MSHVDPDPTLLINIFASEFTVTDKTTLDLKPMDPERLAWLREFSETKATSGARLFACIEELLLARDHWEAVAERLRDRLASREAEPPVVDGHADFIRDGETLFEVLTRMGLEGRRVDPVEGFPSGLDIKGQGRVFGVAVDLGEHLDDGMRAATYAMSLFIERHGLEGAPVGRFDLPSGLLILLGQAPHQGEHDDDGRG